MTSSLVTDPRIGDLRYSVSPTAQRKRSLQRLLPAAKPPSTLLLPYATGNKVSITAKDTLYVDSSYYNAAQNLAVYPYWDWCARSNDGTFDDPVYRAMLAIGKHGLDVFGTVESPNAQGLAMFGTYVVYRPNWQDAVHHLETNNGTPHPRQWFMVDLESWGGAIRGNQSGPFHDMCYAVAEWIAGALKISTSQAIKRVHGYANAGDRAALAPTWPSGVSYVLANYSGISGPAHLIHQFSSSYSVAPFGNVDINSADGYTVEQLATARGIALPHYVPPPPPPVKPTIVVEPSTGNPALDSSYYSNYHTQIGDFIDTKHPTMGKDIGKGILPRLRDIEAFLAKQGYKP